MNKSHEVPIFDIPMPELVSLVDRVKEEVEPNALGEYPLQKTANAMYFKLSAPQRLDPTGKRFYSRDFAIFLMNNSRRLGIQLHA